MEKEYGIRLLAETIGMPIKIISSEYQEIPISGDANNTYQEIIFQIEEEDPDIWAIGLLFTLSLMSFSYAAPRGYSEIEFQPDDEWNVVLFLKGLEYKRKHLCFSADYVMGRLMKTDIEFESGGKVTLRTRNRGKSADRWLLNLQGKKHIRKVE